MRDMIKFLPKALNVVGGFVKDAAFRELESVRIARAACSLLLSGASARTPIFKAAAELLDRRQQPDGGWGDLEETTWAARMLRLVRGDDNPAVCAAHQWLESERKSTGGWGRHARDQARIPTTALVTALIPSAARPEDAEWLTNEWKRDLSGKVRLSYKAGFFLLATRDDLNDDIVSQTIACLIADQNDDGGFGPWRNHPIGSEPWSTGVALWGLSRWGSQVDPVVFEKSLKWLEENQLDSGWWRYHYLDDGAALALIGGVNAIKTLTNGG